MSKSGRRSRCDSARRFAQLSVGSILWLPAKENIDGSLLAGSSTDEGAIDEGAFNHPFLVLSLNSPKKMAVGFLLTSFHGQDLMERYPENPQYPNNLRIRQNYLPISPSAVHPDLGILIVLQGKRTLRAKSYIRTDKRVTISYGALIRYDRDGTRYKLELESFKILTAHINRASPPIRPVLRDVCSNPQSFPPDQQRSHPTNPFQSTQPVDLNRLLADRYPPRNVSPIRPQAPPIPRSKSFNSSLPVIRESWEERRMYGIRTLNERTPLLPQTHAPTRAQESSVWVKITKLILWLIFWSLVAYGGYWVYLFLCSRR